MQQWKTRLWKLIKRQHNHNCQEITVIFKHQLPSEYNIANHTDLCWSYLYVVLLASVS